MPESTPNFPELEERILERWRAHRTFEKIQAERRGAERFVFWEGPPYANGRPGIHHVLARAYKDAFARYQTMRGKLVDRKAGWDTHGLPTELDVEKRLGVKRKKEIEERIGIERFVEECRANTFGYREEWEKLTERIGYWVDLEHPYITYTNEYIESVWWVLSEAWRRKLLEEDFKVVPWCTRCGTALSSHELAQGYQTVKDRSVYLKFELKDEPGTFVLAWTTTPWTLPGNVALAVSSKAKYSKITLETGESYVVEETRIPHLFGNKLQGKPRIVKDYSIVGKSYRPLFDFLDLGKESGKKAYYIADADFVSTDEGTGVVHTAVMYGEDDFALGRKLDLPMVHTVNLDGTFTALVKPWAGKYVKDPATEKAIVEELKASGKLFAEETVEHEYPFCWRCKSPVLYMARTTWFVRMSKLKQELLAANATVNWVPAYIKDGRFGEWLREVKDWAIARDRYWGVPLPIWRCDACDHREFVGDYAQLRSRVKPRNRFILVRHGESKNNVEGTLNTVLENKDVSPLTEHGRRQAETVAKQLAKDGVDAVFTSQFLRARQTAEIIAKEAGVPVTEDARINEFRIGPEFEGKPLSAFHAVFTTAERAKRFDLAPEDGESWRSVWKRLCALLTEIDARNEGKTIVVATHGDPALVALWATQLLPEAQVDALEYPKHATAYPIAFIPAFYRADGTFDPHRPYLDRVTWPCAECGKGTVRRVPEVADVWLDSGSMPFAQWHYPFENRAKVDEGEAFPADFIAEGIDQTRGWFYTLLAVSVLTGRAAPYRTVVSLGLINDAEGRKMSKSVGNIVDPWAQVAKHGADAVRWFLFSTSGAGEFKNYDERGVAEGVRKVFLILSNTVSFLETYGVDGRGGAHSESGQALDRWVEARRARTVHAVTEAMDRYDATAATRHLAAFITDLSTWYLRRSRDRFKGEEAPIATHVLRESLAVAVRLLAPFAPFTAEALWARLERIPPEEVGLRSVHGAPWPEPASVSTHALEEMETARRVVEVGHALRRKRALKVRQPLGQVVVAGAKLSHGVRQLVADELNVQEVVLGTPPGTAEWERADAGGVTVALDATVTDALKELGMVREVVRAVNQLRKERGLTPDARPRAVVASAVPLLTRFAEHYRDALVRGGRLADLTVAASVPDGSAGVALPDGELRIHLEP